MIEGKEAFEKFWQTYPPERHTQRSAARMSFDIAFHSLITEHGSAAAAMAFLLERVNRYLRSPLATKENRKYCLNPKRFIDERRWEDADEAWGYKRTSTAPRKATSALEDIAIYRQQVEEEKAQGKQVSLVEMFNARRAKKPTDS